MDSSEILYIRGTKYKYKHMQDHRHNNILNTLVMNKNNFNYNFDLKNAVLIKRENNWLWWNVWRVQIIFLKISTYALEFFQIYPFFTEISQANVYKYDQKNV